MSRTRERDNDVGRRLRQVVLAIQEVPRRVIRALLGRRFAFRIRINLAPGRRLNIDTPHLTIPTHAGSLVLRSFPRTAKVPISAAEVLVLEGLGFPTEAVAQHAGERAFHALRLALTHAMVGADFGDRAPKSFFFAPGLAMLSAESRAPVLNDVHGLMTYQYDSRTLFARIPPPTLTLLAAADGFLSAFHEALDGPTPSASESVCMDLFHAATFSVKADARFILLVIAVETLLDPQPRSPEAVALVDSFIAEVGVSGLPREEAESLRGSLRYLRNESINQAGRRLARTVLSADARYDGKDPVAFFKSCYEMRSQLAHGRVPLPGVRELGQASAQLELFVRDLISARARKK